MKDKYQQRRLVLFCRLFGVTTQAFYQHNWRKETIGIEEDLIVKQIKLIRQKHPVLGGRKLFELLHPFMLEHGIKMGRDALFDVLAYHRLLIKRRKRTFATTQSYHRFRKYPNSIRNILLTHINQLWVSDLTYFKIKQKPVYISFIMDAYSKKIVGYQLAQTMEAIHTQNALKMALKNNPLPPQHQLIHHSDRGTQYCCDEYIKILTKKHIQISMTENGDPLENAIAERLNGIIKEEYLEHYTYKKIPELQHRLDLAVNLYNTERPHLSCNMLTPERVHKNKLTTTKRWKNYYTSKIKPQTTEDMEFKTNNNI